MYQRNRNLVTRESDGRLVNVARMRGHLFVCSENCCCGRTEDGFAAVPAAFYNAEWERRRLRNVVHLTIGGCLGPCALANVAMLLFEGRALWFHSVDSDEVVTALFDHVDAMLDANEYLAPSGALAEHWFTASTWEERPDHAPVDDFRSRVIQRRDAPEAPAWACQIPEAESAERAVADMHGATAMPRKNGELVFESPWEGRAFGMAVALNELGAYDWEEFRGKLIRTIGGSEGAEPTDPPSTYYERWLASLESVLVEGGVLEEAEITERAYQYEFGEREVFF
jgi:nitrile hydratase accessory protein